MLAVGSVRLPICSESEKGDVDHSASAEFFWLYPSRKRDLKINTQVLMLIVKLEKGEVEDSGQAGRIFFCGLFLFSTALLTSSSPKDNFFGHFATK